MSTILHRRSQHAQERRGGASCSAWVQLAGRDSAGPRASTAGTCGSRGKHGAVPVRCRCSMVQYAGGCTGSRRQLEARSSERQRRAGMPARESRSAAAAELGAASFAHADCRNRCRIKVTFFQRIIQPRPPRARRHRLPGSRNDRRGSGGRWEGLPSGRSRAGVLDARIVVVIGVKRVPVQVNSGGS